MPIIIVRTRNNQFRYRITGKNGETLLHSEPMLTKQAIKKSIAAVGKEFEAYPGMLDVIDRTGKAEKLTSA